MSRMLLDLGVCIRWCSFVRKMRGGGFTKPTYQFFAVTISCSAEPIRLTNSICNHAIDIRRTHVHSSFTIGLESDPTFSSLQCTNIQCRL